MSYQIVDPDLLEAGPGPHPAASMYDKRVSEHLGLRAFEAYFVELPAGGETVRHTHVDDGVEDLYVLVSGDGWLVVDDEEVAVRPHQFVAVSLESERYLRAGAGGMSFLAVCGGAG